MKKLLTLGVILSGTLQAQSQCLTDHLHDKAKKEYPGIAAEEQRFNAGVVQVGNAKRATKYIIPVVFHVIHTNGPENISKAQIEDQIRILNQDFSFTNPNKSSIRSQFANVTADCEIEFRLAQIDPQGKCTDGINRVYSPLHIEARDNVKGIPGARWDNRKYLNIWTVSSIVTQGGGTSVTLGFAYLPSSIAMGLSNMDGIVARADFIGTIGTGNVKGAGRTLTHEVGHYLGLLHTFDDGCGGAGSNAGDYCGDTPPVADTYTNQNCPANGNSCASDNPNLLDQWENYMDYSEGSCQSMFTLNQKSRMHYTLTNYSFRISLVSNNNLIGTGVIKTNTGPLAFFSSNSRSVCTGEPVYFYDNSCKATVDSKQWSFTGANVSSTNKDTPVIYYSSPGKYKVTLTVTNANGSNTLSIDDYIEVKPRVALDKPSVIQDFGNINWNVSTGWLLGDIGAVKFIYDANTGYRGNNSVYAPNSSVSTGERFQLITPPIDLRPLIGKNPKISMMLAYLKQNAASSEEFRIYYSRGCEYVWNQFIFRNANFMSYNTSLYSPSFKPSDPSHWKQATFSLSTFENDSNISFMIEINSGEGNPVYIDEINIGQFNTSISAPENISNLNIYPNPSGDVLNISFYNAMGETEIWLENPEGKKVATLLTTEVRTGEINVEYRKDQTLNHGIYILKIRSNDQMINKKVIFAN